MDFSAWGILEARVVDKVPCLHVETLMSAIFPEVWDMTEDTVRAAVAQVGRRLHAVHKNGGGPIERD